MQQLRRAMGGCTGLPVARSLKSLMLNTEPADGRVLQPAEQASRHDDPGSHIPRSRIHFQRKEDPEAGALTQLALDANRAAHQ